jgi:hypothetical protein
VVIVGRARICNWQGKGISQWRDWSASRGVCRSRTSCSSFESDFMCEMHTELPGGWKESELAPAERVFGFRSPKLSIDRMLEGRPAAHRWT